MLAQVYSLTSDEDFDTVKKNGRKVRSTNFTLCVYKRENGDVPRFGFVIPNKVVPKAHDRNRIKRVLSEATRYQVTYVSPLYDCVFLPNPSMLRAYTADVMKEVSDCFKKAKILK